MTYEEYRYKLKGSKLTEKDLRELFERERLRDEKYDALLKENEAMREKHRWHYPSKGELPEECETVLGYAIKSEHKMLIEIYLRDGEWQLTNGMLGVGYEVIAWQYIEPPEEQNK